MTLVEIVQKKLREARFFLRQLEGIARRPVGDPEEFDFVLSAFLSASRSITDRLENRKYGQWYEAWRNQSSRHQELLEFICDQRIAEVHRDGADVKVRVEFVPAQMLDDQGFYSSNLPGVEPPKIGIKVRSFKLGSTQVEASGRCRDIVTVLDALVTDFSAAYP